MKRNSFNVFQRLVRQWDQLHPYNAAQVVKIAAPLNRETVAARWHAALDTLGLGCVRITGKSFHHECLNGQAQSHGVAFLAPGTCLEVYLSAQINSPFPPADSVPFRAFVLEEEGTHWMGVIYQHWVGDSASIRMLLEQWFLRIHAPESARTRPLAHAAQGYWKTFGPDRAHWELWEGVLSSLRWAGRFRRVRRVEGSGFFEFKQQFLYRKLPEGLIPKLRAAARHHHATVNDVFLAAIAMVCHKHVPAQRTSRRQDLALGTIVDLRPRISRDLSNVFGLFLGFTSVICRPKHWHDWDKLLESIAVQSALHKKTGVPQASFVRMLAGLAAGKWMSARRVANFYRRRVPLVGGISNINLNKTWAAKFHPGLIVDFIRVSPTGPMMPLVFTTTTIGETLNFGLTYRQSIVSDETARLISEDFMQRLTAVVDGIACQAVT